MKGLLVLIVAVALAVSVSGQQSRVNDYFERYENAQVWRFRPTGAGDGRLLMERIEQLGLDVWMATDSMVDVLVPAQLGGALSTVQRLFPFVPAPELFVANVAEKMREQLDVRAAAAAAQAADPSDPSWFLSYHPYDEIVAFMNATVAQNPSLARAVTIGYTVEGRAIQGVVLGRQQQQPVDKRHIFFTGCIHAREWISCATMQYLIQWLVAQADQPDSLLDQFDWTIVPVTNVDGYLWTWSNDRMWRKNRRKNNLCYGVDNNRNFAYQWATTGSSNQPCGQTYHGTAPASEPETQAVQSYIDKQTNLVAYADIHAYGQLWMTPWGWTPALPPTNDYDAQITSSKDVVDAIYQVNGRNYTIGPISTTIYPASGSSADYAYGTKNVVLSYAVELRGPQNSQSGFLLPPSEIIPQGQEFVAGIAALADYINNEIHS